MRHFSVGARVTLSLALAAISGRAYALDVVKPETAINQPSNAASAQTLLGSARGTGQTLMAWMDQADLSQPGLSLRAARIADDGTVLDQTPLDLGPLPSTGGPASAAFAADTYLVAWFDGDIRAARVSTAGNVLDTTPILVAKTSTNGKTFLAEPRISVGYDGQEFVVSWAGLVPDTEGAPSPWHIQLVGLDGSLPGSPFIIGSDKAGQEAFGVLMTGSNACIAAWTDLSGLQLAAIGPGGVVGPSRTPISSSGVVAPGLVPVGSQMLLVGGRTWAMLDSNDPFAATGQTYSPSQDVGFPSWDGAMFVSLVQTVPGYPVGTDLQPGFYVSVMSTDGTLATPTMLFDGASSVSSDGVVGLGGGRSLVLYSRSASDRAFGNSQAFFQIVATTAISFPDGGAGNGAGPVVTSLGKSGCSCEVSRGAPAAWGWIAVAFALLLARRRSRRC